MQRGAVRAQVAGASRSKRFASAAMARGIRSTHKRLSNKSHRCSSHSTESRLQERTLVTRLHLISTCTLKYNPFMFLSYLHRTGEQWPKETPQIILTCIPLPHVLIECVGVCARVLCKAKYKTKQNKKLKASPTRHAAPRLHLSSSPTRSVWAGKAVGASSREKRGSARRCVSPRAREDGRRQKKTRH